MRIAEGAPVYTKVHNRGGGLCCDVYNRRQSRFGRGWTL